MTGGEDLESFADDLSQNWDEPVETSQTEVAETAEAYPAIDAPQHWSQQDKDTFASLPDATKPLYLEKVRSLEAGFNRKFESIANDRRTYESLNEVLGPVAHLFNEETTPASYVGKLIQIGAALESDPAATLRALAASYGVDLGSGPEEMETHLQSQLHAQATSFRDAIYGQEWAALMREHPQAESLRARIGYELQVNPPRNETVRQALQRAFETTKWTDPEIRKSILDKETKANQAETQRKADLAKARRSGDSISRRGKTSPGFETRIPAKTWAEELERNWDGHA